MSEVTFPNELRLANVLSFRKKLPAAQLQIETQRIQQYIADNGLRVVPPSASATHAIEQTGAAPVLDFELLLPLDGEFTPPEGCTRKPEIFITNAVRVRHTGNPQTLQTSINEMQQYITSNGLQPITVGYSVMVAEPKSPAELDSAVIDVYMGVSQNRL